MNNYTRPLSRLIPVLVLALTLRTVSAQGMAPSGSFGFLVNALYVNASPTNGTAVLGVMNFDGAGNVTGSYTFEINGSATQPMQTTTGTFTGTYSSNTGGTGSMTLAFDSGITPTFAM